MEGEEKGREGEGEKWGGEGGRKGEGRGKREKRKWEAKEGEKGYFLRN